MPRTSLKQKVALITFGLFLGIILLEIGLRIGGLIFIHLQEKANIESLRKKKDYVILCLGESTTALGGDDSYPRQLERILNGRDIGVKFSVINKGIAATNTAAIANLLGDHLDQYQPDMVLTMIGINDDGGHRALQDISPDPLRRFLRNLRVYKLATLLYDHTALTIRDAELSFFPGEDSEPPDGELSAESPLPYPELRSRLESRLDSDPDNPRFNLELGVLLMDGGELAAAEQYYRKAEALSPGTFGDQRDQLMWHYFDQGLHKECIRIGEELIASKDAKIPANRGSYSLARSYLCTGKPAEAERVCRLILKNHPDSAEAWGYLGDALRSRRSWQEAETAYRWAVELEPLNISFTHLMEEYIRRQEFGKADKLARTLLARRPDDTRLLGATGHLHQVWYEHKLAEHIANNGPDAPPPELVLNHLETADYYYRESAIRQNREYKIKTINSYQRISAALKERGIALVCVQYPMRSIEPLKIILSGREEPIFVDNSEIFREGVKRKGFQHYFADCFGGDFGHCTPEGNRLLAENISDTILKEYFQRPGQKKADGLPLGEQVPVGGY